MNTMEDKVYGSDLEDKLLTLKHEEIDEFDKGVPSLADQMEGGE